MSVELSILNAMIPGSYAVQKHPPDLSILEGLGYTIVPVDTLDVLYSNPYLVNGDYSLRELADGGRYDVVLSGPNAMIAPGQYPPPPNGPVFRNGGLEVDHHRSFFCSIDSYYIFEEEGEGWKDVGF